MKNAILTLLFVTCASTATAEQILCEFDSWRGASKKIGVTWTGEKVFIDTRQNPVQRGFSDGWYEAQGISKISKAGDFTTYTTQNQERDAKGKTYTLTMSVRVYDQGKGTSRISAGARMQDITASGRCTKG